MNSKAVFATVMVYIGCGLNNVFLEYTIKQDPGSGHLITFLQFLFIAIHGFIFTHKFGSIKPKIPYSVYFTLVVMFFLTSVVNNWAFNFNIPVPLHMIFRSGSLIANMILGILILRKKYKLSKYISVFMVTVGIIICTLVSSQQKSSICTDCSDQTDKNSMNQPQEEDKYFLFWWIVGIALLTFALLLSARMGIYQEWLASKYGKHPEEALYFTHMLSLPGFLIYSGSIYEHARIATYSEPFSVFFLSIPILWIYLIGNIITQYLCISSVYTLTTEVSSLTLTLIITLRKFFSLMFSIIYFKNPFTVYHWLGTVLVFTGTLIFSEVPAQLNELFKKKKKD
ncbi:UDP-xylose and UDP-N-acetylglucosamine transporter-like [Agrilus planipennis]|uniref:UDP-xylose and UDP-N-acetylglucosamine transporter n=1 Tax=Agrilus planipennis TaxID=224129 RepID=A0A1W4X2Q0_AGRPL|nr:UDP-xylose and UDP-N-acetylglucosamine transporter [Agrilus planipennis]XP_025835101.1 UDP-xylose and UDP-N-acetylglucosamine transporter-like [Agrilus planipennis]